MTQIKKTRQEEVFSKKELLQAECLKPFKDIAAAVLESDKPCTLQEAGKKIDEFMKGKVR